MSTFTLTPEIHAPSRRIDYHKELNQEQLDVVLHGDGPCLVLAGAGSGKTRTLTYRVAYLLEQGVDPSSILLLTFTNKAAREMLERVTQLVGDSARGIWGGTFHSIANRLLRAFAEGLGYNARFSILDADDAEDMVKAVMKDAQIDPKARRFPSASVVANIISYSRNTLTPIEDVLSWKHPNFLSCANDIEDIARRYAERKREANVVDFDDLLTEMKRVLEHPQYGPQVAGAFKYVLVDEFQDTNVIQASLVRGFARTCGNVLVVGDDAQSIYAFRGADVKNILSFPKEWAGSKIFKLLTNYRSTPQILELANESLSHNVDQFQKELHAVRERAEKPKFIPCSSAMQEARYVADQILELRGQGVALREMAVLFRSSAHSQSLEFELMKRDIPYEYRGGQKFFERAHIKDVVAFLRTMENPKDEIAWLRTLSLHEGIGATTAISLGRAIATSYREESGESVATFITSGALESAIPNRARAGWNAFAETFMRMKSATRPAEMIRGILTSAYREHLEQEYPNWRDRLEDLEQLAVFAETYEDAGAFLADIALYDDVISGRNKSHADANQERMVLSTIHQAKGLEWDSVFVIHLADGGFPSRRAMEEDGGMEEERRLFYVAVTRARRRLFLSYPVTMGYDALVLQQPSTFIEEVPSRCFERVELREPGTSAFRRPAIKSADEWSDDGYEEPTIHIDRSGNYKQAPSTATAWKSSSNKQSSGGTSSIPSKRTSFLRDVDEL